MPPVFKRPRPKTKSIQSIERDIQALVENVRSHISSTKRAATEEHANSPSSKLVRFEPPKEPADNTYAKEIFLAKTNVREIAREIVLQDGDQDLAKADKLIRRFRDKLYRYYANEPKYRIREPLDRVQFVSNYYEYRFYLALNMPLRSDQEYQEYRDLLKEAGVQECWVQMRENNLLLKHEDTILRQRTPEPGTTIDLTTLGRVPEDCGSEHLTGSVYSVEGETRVASVISVDETDNEHEEDSIARPASSERSHLKTIIRLPKASKFKFPSPNATNPDGSCQLLSTIADYLHNNQTQDQYDLIGRNFAYKLKALEPDQRLIAEKLINDVLFEAQWGSLSKHTQLANLKDGHID